MTIFSAFDVETANPDFSSICKIGLVYFEDGKVTDTWSTLIDPEDYFDPINVEIHGITEDQVRGAPKFPAVLQGIWKYLESEIFVHHTAFDRVSLGQAAGKYHLSLPNIRWLDSARVARRTWDEVRYKGYGLDNLATMLGIKFMHHDPTEDARAAGEILTKAIEVTGISLEDWLTKAYGPLTPTSSIRQDGNPDGPLYGHVIVFTGALSMARFEAAKMAAEAGCTVGTGVTKDTTLLVVGDQDIRKLAGNEKSGKHRKAEELIAKGQDLRILRETDFIKIIRTQ